METLSKDFPPGIEYTIVYNPTEFIEQSIEKVYLKIIQLIDRVSQINNIEEWR